MYETVGRLHTKPILGFTFAIGHFHGKSILEFFRTLTVARKNDGFIALGFTTSIASFNPNLGGGRGRGGG